MATRILSCLIALTFVLSSTGPLTAAQPPQPPPPALPAAWGGEAPPPAPSAAAAAAAAADASIAALLAQATSVAAGEVHTCALTSAGGVKCWGSNYSGQLGDGTTTARSTPVAVVGLASGVVAVAAGDWHTCALTSAGGVQCWGNNRSGQLGDGTTTHRSTPVAVSGLASGVLAVAAGRHHTCAVTSAGGVQCWGANNYGQLGDGTTTDRSSPVAVSGLASGVAAVTVGEEHTCALTSAGGVQCWGYNLYGRLGDGTGTDRYTPVAVVGLASGVVAVAAGDSHTCALTSAGGVQCWGCNFSGQLGDGTTTNRYTPVAVSGLASGVGALTSAGGVQCWGFNWYGQLGDGMTTHRSTPVAVSGLASGVAAVTAGGEHTCALTSAGGVQCWGYNLYGQLGDGTETNRYTPVAVSGLASGVAAVAAGDGHTCAVTSAGGVQCWGRNYYCQLGDGTWTNHPTPVAVVGLASGVAAVAAGEEHTCAVTSAGGVQCWGCNFSGQLGDGTTAGICWPVAVSGLASGVVAVAAGGSHTCALTSAG
ncbi:MAG: RCC1 repeat-containing protein, partial [Chloroflexi bacterium HGW-Chloroflexi-1]